MKILRVLKSNKKGFSLVELIVTMAITSVVIGILATVVYQGSRISRKQNAVATLANEVQQINGMFEEAIMEAKVIDGYTTDSTVYKALIYTGEVNESGTGWNTDTGTERIIIIYDNYIYILSEYTNLTLASVTESYVTSLSDGYKLTENLDIMSITADATKQLVTFAYTLANDEADKSTTLEVKARNTLDVCSITAE